MEKQITTKQFRAEVQQVLDLVIHSLYSNKEIFLRELISNAADALDKLRFAALSEQSLYEKDTELQIKVSSDKEAKTITVSDNGIGMSLEDIGDCLGTIANSGTKRFVEQLTDAQKKDSNLIGQFGVGFYSAFMVAKRVEVFSRPAGQKRETGVYWVSEGNGEFSVQSIDKAKRGTKIILHLKEDAEEFLAIERLRYLVTSYCDHIAHPVVMLKEDDKEGTVNNTNPIWARDKKTLQEKDYHEFYHQNSYTKEAPISYSHGKVEGTFEYSYLLYVPHQLDSFISDRQNYPGLKLYVNRILIMEHARELLPPYLRFVQGVLDSPDLPLNVSREMLQQDKTVESLRNGCVRKILDMLTTLADKEPESYLKFWKEFGQIFKEGLTDFAAPQEKIMGLLRFSYSTSSAPEQVMSIEQYVKEMPAEQKAIYYIVGSNFHAAMNSPHMERFISDKTNVLVLDNQIDGWIESRLDKFNDIAFQSVTKEQTEQASSDDNKTTFPEQITQLSKKLAAQLAEKVKDVKPTTRLRESPCCLLHDSNSIDQRVLSALSASGHKMTQENPILEINPEHPLIKNIAQENDSEKLSLWSDLLYQQAVLSEGKMLDNPGNFIQLINTLLTQEITDKT